MDTEKSTAKKLTPKQEHFMELENTCCLCGTELVFAHKPDDKGEGVTEQAQCPCCNILLKEKKYLIH